MSKSLIKSGLNDNALATNLKAFFFKPQIHIILVVLLGCIIYSNTFRAPFEFDDRRSIIDNKAIKDISTLTNISRLNAVEIDPEVRQFIISRYVGYLSFAVNHNVHNLDVTGYHITNLSIHIVNALLLYWLMLLTFKTPFFEQDAKYRSDFALIALFSSLLFVCHPIQTGAVTYVVQRFASLATLFYLCSLVFYVQSRLAGMFSLRLLFYVLAIISTIVAMFTKEISFTLPIVILLYDGFFFKGNLKRRFVYLLPFLLTILIIPLTLISNSQMIKNVRSVASSFEIANLKGISMADYLYTQFRVIITYIRLLFIPTNQNLDYDYKIYNSFFTPDVYLSFILLAIIFIIAIYLFYRSRGQEHTHHLMRVISFGIFWFFITLSVESSIIPISDVIFEHRVYLPSIGFFIALVVSSIAIRDKLKTAQINVYQWIIPLLILTILTFSVSAYARNDLWRDDIRLWEDTVKKSPDKVRPHYSLALAYFNQNRLDDTIRELKIVLGKQDLALAHHDLGLSYFKQGRYALAISEYKKAIIKNPDFVEAHADLGVTYAITGMHSDALQELQAAAVLRPTDNGIHKNLGLVYEELDNIDAAALEYSLVVKEKPSFVNELNNLGVALYKQGNLTASIRKYQLVIKLNPDLAQAHYNLALVYENQSHFDQAIEEFKRAISLNPDLASAHYHLAVAYKEQGHIKDAIGELTTALKLQPNFADAINLHNVLKGKIRT